MAAWSSFYPFLLPFVAGAADPVLDQALVGAAREFYGRTRAWRPWLAPVTILADERDYALTLPADTVIERIEQATVDGSPFSVLSYYRSALDPAVAEGPQTGLMTQDRLTITLARLLPVDAVLRIQVSLKPAEAATTLADAEWAQHARSLAKGAQALLQDQPDKPWSNPLAARAARDEFNQAIARVCADVHRGFANPIPRARVKWC